MNLSMLHVEQMVAVQEHVCAARAPVEGEKLSQALEKWRGANKELLNDLQQASMAFEEDASRRFADPADKAELQKGFDDMFVLAGAKQWAGNTIFATFAALTDAQAKAMCTGYVHEAQETAWLRREMLAALASVSRKK